jgi:hypothetical protein
VTEKDIKLFNSIFKEYLEQQMKGLKNLDNAETMKTFYSIVFSVEALWSDSCFSLWTSIDTIMLQRLQKLVKTETRGEVKNFELYKKDNSFKSK